jgi:hypothetical protein
MRYVIAVMCRRWFSRPCAASGGTLDPTLGTLVRLCDYRPIWQYLRIHKEAR